MPNQSWDLYWRDHGVASGARGLSQNLHQTKLSTIALGSALGVGLTKAAGIVGRAVGDAAQGVVRFGVDSVKAYGEAQKSQFRLEDAYRKFPKLADTNIGSLQRLNQQLALKTRFDDDAAASGQAVLAQYKLTGKQITELTPLLEDYAAKTGKDLPAAASVLGKALLGKGRALAAVGINFKDTGSQAKNYDQIIGGLRKQVGGFATREGATFAGRVEIIKNRFGEWQESLGGKLQGRLSNILGGVSELMGVAEDAGPILDVIWDGFIEGAGLSKAASADLAEAVKTHQDEITDAIFGSADVMLDLAQVAEVTASAVLVTFGALTKAVATAFATITLPLQKYFELAARAPFAPSWIKDTAHELRAFNDGFLTDMQDSGQAAEDFGRQLDEKLGGGIDGARRRLKKLHDQRVIADRQHDAVVGMDTALKRIEKTAKLSKDELASFDRESLTGTTRQIRLRDRLDEARDAFLRSYKASDKSKQGQEAFHKAAKKTEDQLYRELKALGLDKDQARKYAKEITNIPTKQKTKHTSNAKETQSATHALHREIDDVPKTPKIKWTVDWDTRVDSINTKLVKAGGRFAFQAAVAEGGAIPGRGPKGVDSVPILAAPGEHMWAAHEVDAAGGHAVMRRWRKEVAAGRMHGMSMGGEVPRYAAAVNLGGTAATSAAGTSALTRLFKAAALMGFGSGVGANTLRNMGTGQAAAMAAARRLGASYVAFHRDPLGAPSFDAGASIPLGQRIVGHLLANRNPYGVKYIIHNMRIWSARNWGGRTYTPISSSGDFRHIRHVHSTYFGGGLRPGLSTGGVATRPGLYPLAENGPERVLSARQSRNFERLVNVMDHSGGSGGGDTYITVNAPNVADTNGLRRMLVDMNKRGELAGSRR